MAINRSPIVGVFDERAKAEQAIEELYNAGIHSDRIVYSGGESSNTGGSFLDNLKSLFTGIGGARDPHDVANDLANIGLSQDEANYYAQEYQQGHTIIAVQPGEQEDNAMNILRSNGAYNFRSRSNFQKMDNTDQAGYNPLGFDKNADVMAPDSTTTRYTQGNYPAGPQNPDTRQGNAAPTYSESATSPTYGNTSVNDPTMNTGQQANYSNASANDPAMNANQQGYTNDPYGANYQQQANYNTNPNTYQQQSGYDQNQNQGMNQGAYQQPGYDTNQGMDQRPYQNQSMNQGSYQQSAYDTNPRVDRGSYQQVGNDQQPGYDQNQGMNQGPYQQSGYNNDPNASTYQPQSNYNSDPNAINYQRQTDYGTDHSAADYQQQSGYNDPKMGTQYSGSDNMQNMTAQPGFTQIPNQRDYTTPDSYQQSQGRNDDIDNTNVAYDRDIIEDNSNDINTNRQTRRREKEARYQQDQGLDTGYDRRSDNDYNGGF